MRSHKPVGHKTAPTDAAHQTERDETVLLVRLKKLRAKRRRQSLIEQILAQGPAFPLEHLSEMGIDRAAARAMFAVEQLKQGTPQADIGAFYRAACELMALSSLGPNGYNESQILKMENDPLAAASVLADASESANQPSAKAIFDDLRAEAVRRTDGQRASNAGRACGQRTRIVGNHVVRAHGRESHSSGHGGESRCSGDSGESDEPGPPLGGPTRPSATGVSDTSPPGYEPLPAAALRRGTLRHIGEILPAVVEQLELVE